MWQKYLNLFSVLLLLVSCGSDGATVGGPDPITASGMLTVTGSGAANIAPAGVVKPTVGFVITGTNPSYTLKFDDTTLAVNILYDELASGAYQLVISSIGVSNSGTVYGFDYETISNNAQITGITVDKAKRTIRFQQVLLTEPQGTGQIVVDGTLQVL